MTYENEFPILLEAWGVKNFSALELAQVGRVAGAGRSAVTLQAPPCELWGNIKEAALLVQALRDHLGGPVIINSGYRDEKYNRKAGGSPNSQHILFRALDIRSPTASPGLIYAWLDGRPESDRIGLGLYPTFVHIDTRGTRARF